mgnify:FL=1
MKFSHSEHSVKNVTESQTSICNCYTFQLETVSFHFIDTPGIGDTTGVLQDIRNLDNIFNYIEKFSQIDSFILVLNGATTRFNSNITHVLNSMKERLPDSLYSNMLIILTNCYNYTVNFQPNVIGLANKCPVFCMQNSAFSSDPKRWPRKTQERFENEFRSSMKIINSIIQELCKLDSQSTSIFKRMTDDRNVLKRELHHARLAFMDLQRLEDELASISLTADIHAANMDKFRNYLQRRKIRQFIRYETPYYNTTCSKCNMVCHEKCQLDEMPAVGNKKFYHCLAMETGVCNVCPNRCKAKDHYHDRWIVVAEESTVEEVVISIEKRYREAEKGRSNAYTKCKDINEAKQMIENELQKQYNKIEETIINLQANCSGFNVTSELSDFIADVKRDISGLQSKSTIDKANLFITSLEELWNNFQRNSSMNYNQHEKPITDAVASPTSDKSSDTINAPPKITIRESAGLYSQQNSDETSSPKVTYDNEIKEMDVDTEERVNNQLVSCVNQTSDQRQMLSITSSNTNVENKPDQFKLCTLDELIQASRQNESKELRKELNNRCLGKSVGLLTSNELFQLCEQYTDLRSKDVQELILIRDKISEEIDEETDHDPFNIVKTNRVKLLRLAAINLLLHNLAALQKS